MAAQDVAGMERVRADGGPATAAGGTEVMQPLQVAALAFPVADRIIHKFQIADAAKIRDGKYRVEYGLQADVLALVGQQVHLQKPLIGIPLYFDQVRDRYGGLNFGKINSLGGSAVVLNIHSYTPDGRTAKAKKLRLTAQSQKRPARRCLPGRE